jgi:hypothetical protein
MDMELRAEQDINSQDIIQALFEETGTDGPPTDAEAIAEYLELMIETFNHDDWKYDDWKPSLKTRAFLWPAKGLIGVHSTLTPKRRTFSVLHEIGHFVLPGHTVDLDEYGRIVDEASNLSVVSSIPQEIEANQFAADCLFQLDRFDREMVRSKQLNWANIKLAANRYNASFEATARRWVERSSQDCALVVFNPVARKPDATLEVMYTITSNSFEKTYFSRLERGQKVEEDSLLHKFFYGYSPYQEEREDNLHVRFSPERVIEFPMHLFSNSYRLFGLVTPPRD